MWTDINARLSPLAERLRPWLEGPERNVTAFRVLVFVHLLAFLTYYRVVHRELWHWLDIRIEDSFFPPLLQQPWLSTACFLLPFSLLTLCLFVRSLPLWRVSTTSFVACFYILLLHQRSFPEAFVAGNFWGALYTCWFSWSVLGPQLDPDRARKNALALGQLCICFLYFAGALGKLTELYHTGEAFAYWRYPGAALGVLHKWFEADVLAQMYAHMAVLGESVIALSIVLSPRVTFAMMFAVSAGMLNGGTPRFFDAIGPLFAIACVGWMLSARSSTEALRVQNEAQLNCRHQAPKPGT